MVAVRRRVGALHAKAPIEQWTAMFRMGSAILDMGCRRLSGLYRHWFQRSVLKHAGSQTNTYSIARA